MKKRGIYNTVSFLTLLAFLVSLFPCLGYRLRRFPDSCMCAFDIAASQSFVGHEQPAPPANFLEPNDKLVLAVSEGSILGASIWGRCSGLFFHHHFSGIQEVDPGPVCSVRRGFIFGLYRPL